MNINVYIQVVLEFSGMVETRGEIHMTHLGTDVAFKAENRGSQCQRKHAVTGISKTEDSTFFQWNARASGNLLDYLSPPKYRA